MAQPPRVNVTGRGAATNLSIAERRSSLRRVRENDYFRIAHRIAALERLDAAGTAHHGEQERFKHGKEFKIAEETEVLLPREAVDEKAECSLRETPWPGEILHRSS